MQETEATGHQVIGNLNRQGEQMEETIENLESTNAMVCRGALPPSPILKAAPDLWSILFSSLTTNFVRDNEYEVTKHERLRIIL